MTNELLTKASKSIVKPSLSSGKMFIVNSWLGILRLSWIMASWRICCILFQIIRAKSSHHFWMVSKLLWNGAPFPESCCSRFQRFNSWSKIRNWSSFNCLITSRWWFAKLDVWSFKLLNWKRRKKSVFFPNSPSVHHTMRRPQHEKLKILIQVLKTLNRHSLDRKKTPLR